MAIFNALPQDNPPQDVAIQSIPVSASEELKDDELTLETSQNDPTIFFNQDQFKIIKQWRKVHRFLFKHGVYVLVILLGGLGIHGINLLPQPLDLFIEKNTSGREHLAAQQENITPLWDIPGLTTTILYGKLTHEQSILSTVSNLVSYQGIVLPRVAEISTNKQLFDITSFTNKQTSANDIARLVQQLIITPSSKSSTLAKNTTLTLSKGIIEDFNLQCLGTQKVSNIICNKFLDTFFAYGKFYNLQRYPQDLQTIQDSLRSREKEHLQFCTLIYEHAKWYKHNVNALTTIMQQCPEDQWQHYKELSDFITVDQDINSSIISNAISTNPNINAYKLLSLQQILYKNLQAGNPNKNFITSYLTYTQQLINRTNALDPLYIDILYRVNTNILLAKLETSNNTTLSKAETNQIIEQIILLNTGNPRLGDKGLESLVTTPGLVQGRDIIAVESRERSIEELIRPLLEQTGTLRIQRTTIADDEQTVDFNLEISSRQILAIVGETIKARITLYRRGEMLYVQQLTLVNATDLSTYLQNAIKGTNTTIQQLVGMIDEHVEFYHKQPPPLQPQKPLCDTVREDIREINVTSCTDTRINLFKNWIDYTFLLNNEVLVGVNIALNKPLEEQINNKIQSVLITKNNTFAYIKEILQIRMGEPEEEYTEQRVLINERMKRYLNIVPDITNIDENTFVVVFKVSDIILQGTYEVSSHTISNISFVVDEEKNETLLIRDFVLPLDEENRNNLAELFNNPRLYLRLFNQPAFDKYERMMAEKR